MDEFNTSESKYILKYLDYPKFLYLLSGSKLYFNSILQFEDPWEGKIPFKRYMDDDYAKYIINDKLESNVLKSLYATISDKTQKEKIQAAKAWALSFANEKYASKEDCINFHNIILNFFIGKVNLATAENELKEYLRNRRKIYNWGKDFFSKQIFINCWFDSACESDSMWKLYANNGIAIKVKKSNLDDLVLKHIKLVGQNYDYKFQKVEYIDDLKERFEKYDKWTEDDFKNNLGSSVLVPELIYDWFFKKRSHFEHEKEYRCLITPSDKVSFHTQNNIESMKGMDIEIDDLDKFIEEIIISPNALDFYEETIKETLNKMNYSSLSKKVRWSEMISI